MLTLFHLLILMIAIGYCAYYRASFLTSIIVTGVILSFLTYFKDLYAPILVTVWILYILITLVFGIPPLRARFLTKPVLAFFRRAQPPMSNTEREAIDAGDVWWEGELFTGINDWKKLLNMPKPLLTDEEQKFLNEQVEHLCSLLNDFEITAKLNDLPQDVWQYIKKEKFLGMIIPKQYGGLGFSAVAHSCVITKITTRSASAAVNVMVPNSLGPAELLLHYGTEDQKNHYLPRLATGEEIPCFALTGDDAGSDAGAITDFGIVCKGTYQGQETLGVRLTWNKRYITLAPIATALGLAVKLRDPDHLLGSNEEIGITLFLIPTTHPGVEIGRRHNPMGMAFMNGPTHGKDVFVPLDWIIGGAPMAGQGWRMLMECLSVGRAISLPALSAAAGQLSYRATGMYARIRQQFKLPIGKFEAVEAKLAELAGYNYMLGATRTFTAFAVDQKIKPAVASAISKYHMTEMMRTVVSNTMDIHAGKAIQLGPRNYIGNVYRSVPVAITVEGANILTWGLIIFGQGAIRCHPYIQKEMAAAQNPNLDQGFKEFDQLLMAHIGYGISNLCRSFWMGLTGAKFVSTPQNNGLNYYYQQFSRMSTALAFVSDLTMMVLGGGLKRKESLSGRLGDVLSQLYLGSAVLKYFHDLHNQPDDLPYVEWCLQTNLNKIQEAFSDFFANFPIPSLAKLMRFIIFPFGCSYKKPSDKLAHRLAQHMMSPSALRDRLSNLVYQGQANPEDTIGRLENAYKLIIATEAAYQELQKAIKNGVIDRNLAYDSIVEQALNLKLITSEEAVALKEADVARRDLLKVDDFAPNAFERGNL